MTAAVGLRMIESWPHRRFWPGADVGVRAAAAAFPDNELGGETFGLERQGRVGYPLEQAGAGALAEQPHRLADRGQRRRK